MERYGPVGKPFGADSQATILETSHKQGHITSAHGWHIFHKADGGACHKHTGIDLELRWIPGHHTRNEQVG